MILKGLMAVGAMVVKGPVAKGAMVVGVGLHGGVVGYNGVTIWPRAGVCVVEC